MPPPLELDECGSPKRIRGLLVPKFRARAWRLPKCGGDTIKCRGHAFDRSDLDYFEPCAGRVCLECDAPECGTCAQPMPLPFCRACVEMVVYESGSFVADKPEYAQYLCKGGGDDCCCNALVCDDCHDKTTGTRTAAYASALKATRASALKENPLKHVVQGWPSRRRRGSARTVGRARRPSARTEQSAPRCPFPLLVGSPARWGLLLLFAPRGGSRRKLCPMSTAP